MDLTALLSQFGLFAPAVIPLREGTAARVWRVDTEEGSYLLRTLADREQGERESAVMAHLRERGFTCTPEIIAMAEQSGVWYQLQEYCAGTMPDPAAPGMAAAMGRTLRELTRCMPEGMIHGDLGPWNLLLRGDGRLYVIDFGEARPGDPYFDYAACLGGVINHTPEGERAAVCREFLAELEADCPCLLTQLRLWAAEGVGRWSGVSEKMTARFYHALHWAEEHLYEL